MKKLSEATLSRRNFMGLLPGMLAGTSMLAAPHLLSLRQQKEPSLKEELTPEELQNVEKSVMAKDLANYFGKDYSCAESLLMVSLRYLKKPEELVWFAAGFGGGIYHKDLCGFLTSGIMAIGLSSGMLDMARKEAKNRCRDLVKEYWKWWRTVAPLHCAEIRKDGTSSKVCSRLGRLAAAKTEELLKT